MTDLLGRFGGWLRGSYEWLFPSLRSRCSRCGGDGLLLLLVDGDCICATCLREEVLK